MRAFYTLSLGAAALALVASSVAAYAEPAYSKDKLVEIFAKEKGLAAAAKAQGKTRGIHFDLDKSPTPPPELTQARVDLLVTFEFNSDKLTPKAVENLTPFAEALKDPKIKGTKFEIDGHTDATGTEDYNIGLSERRAAAVVAFLVAQGVDASTLDSKGYGKSKPRVNDPFSPENRRVETHLEE